MFVIWSYIDLPNTPFTERHPGIVTERRLSQPSKQSYPMLDKLAGIEIDAKPEQPKKAYQPTLVTLFGIIIEVNPEHPENAEPSILVTLSGIVIDVRPEQFSNAYQPMRVTGMPSNEGGIAMAPVVPVSMAGPPSPNVASPFSSMVKVQTIPSTSLVSPRAAPAPSEATASAVGKRQRRSGSFIGGKAPGVWEGEVPGQKEGLSADSHSWLWSGRCRKPTERCACAQPRSQPFCVKWTRFRVNDDLRAQIVWMKEEDSRTRPSRQTVRARRP